MQTACAMVSTPITESDRLRLGILHDLPLLLRLHATPPTASLLEGLRRQDFPHCLALPPAGVQGHAALAAVEGALAHYNGVLDGGELRALAQDHRALYLSPTEIDNNGRLRRSGDRMVQTLNVVSHLSSAPGHAGFYETAAYLAHGGLADLDDFAHWCARQKCGPLYPALTALTSAYAHDLHAALDKVVSKPRPYLLSTQTRSPA